MKKNIYNNVGIISKNLMQYHRNSVKIDTTNINIHDTSLSWLGTATSIKSGRVKLVLLEQNKEDEITLNTR